MKRRIVWAGLAAALVTFGAGCGAGSSDRTTAKPAHYIDPAGDAGGLPDIRGIDVTASRSGRIAFRVQLVPAPRDVCPTVFIDADADPETGNELDNAGLEYMIGCMPGTSRVDVERWPSPASAGSWIPDNARTATIRRDAASVTLSINRSELRGTREFNFFAARGAAPPGFPDRAPATGTFNYVLGRGGPEVKAAGPTGARPDKAGGRTKGQATVLTLATHDYSDPWSAALVSAVERDSGGSLRIDVKQGWRFYDIEAERGTIADVRHRAVDLALIGARAWDGVGVKSFRALVAPFLIDSFALQRRVLESPLVDHSLKGLRPLGLVGLAILPGGLRRPLGVTGPLRGPEDYRGAKIGIRPARVASATFRALGATATGFPSLPTGLTGFDGAESDLKTIVDNRYDLRARALTANVVLWPRATTLIANAAAFDKLSPDQQGALRRAAREAIAPLVARFQSDEQDSLETICRAKHLALVTASPADRSALRRAVQPVYDELERDALTRKLIDRIDAMRTGSLAAGEPLRCPRPAQSPRSALQGRWHAELTARALRAAGAARDEVEGFAGTWTLEFGNGNWVARSLDRSVVLRGTYVVRGDRLREAVGSCDPVSTCTPGAVTEYKWSVYRDRLSFTLIPGRFGVASLVAQPWIRDR